MIVDAFESAGVRVDGIVACGGLPERNRLLMQIFADVTGREFAVAASSQAPALGSAMFGAVAAGAAAGGYDSIVEASRAHGAPRRDRATVRIAGRHAVYDELYARVRPPPRPVRARRRRRDEDAEGDPAPGRWRRSGPDSPSAHAAVTSEPFGTTPDGTAVERYTPRRTPDGIAVSVITYGAAVQELWAPDRDGRRANVVLGFATLDGYVDHGGHYFGAIVGRYANRIADGDVHPRRGRRTGCRANDGAELAARRSGAASTGGSGRRRCRAGRSASRSSSAGRARTGRWAIPGTLAVRGHLHARRRGSLRIDYRATTDRPTVVNLTNHACWNLAGEGSGTILDHVLELAADRYTPVDADLIPTGRDRSGRRDAARLRRARRRSARASEIRSPQLDVARGYDHNFVLDREDGARSLVAAARVREPTSGRGLDVYTTEPGVQLYSGNILDGTLVGTSGRAVRAGRRLRARDPALPRLAEPAELSVDGAAAGRASSSRRPSTG